MEQKIFSCTCKSEFQNSIYGKGNRVFNPKGKGEDLSGYRCTVCGKEISSNSGKRR